MIAHAIMGALAFPLALKIELITQINVNGIWVKTSMLRYFAPASQTSLDAPTRIKIYLQHNKPISDDEIPKQMAKKID